MSWTDWFGGTEEAEKPRRYEISNRRITCPHCDHDEFVKGPGKLVSPSTALFDAEYAAPDATILTCDHCGRIEWFASSPEPTFAE